MKPIAYAICEGGTFQKWGKKFNGPLKVIVYDNGRVWDCNLGFSMWREEFDPKRIIRIKRYFGIDT